MITDKPKQIFKLGPFALWTQCVGWFTIDIGNYSVHMFPPRDEWCFGIKYAWYDGPLKDFGLGPLALICWQA